MKKRYRSVLSEGRRYCVAPIIDTTLDVNQTVSMWGVGIDCCDSRASFTCLDAHRIGAHSGVILLQSDLFVHPYLDWLMRNYEQDRERYMRAIDLARHSFAIPVHAHHQETDVLVNWTFEPYRLQHDMKVNADWYAGMFSIFFVFLWVVGESLLHRRQQQLFAKNS